MGLAAEVVGLGPAGSAFARLYGSVCRRERAGSYTKPCGEAVPSDTPLVGREHVIDKVRSYRFYCWRREIGEVSYARARWYIVNKRAWVESLRDCLEPSCGRADIIVRAGGPYQSAGEKIIVARAYVKGVRLSDETAYFVFLQGAAGFFWAFPRGGLLNVGGGFIGARDSTPHLLYFVRRWLGGGHVLDVRGAPLTVSPRVLLHDGSGFRVGEAAGLVFPLTGEGVRPAVLSAMALARALRSKRPLAAYRKELEGVIRQIEFQKRVLGLVRRAIAGGIHPLSLADDGVLRDYIEENLSARTLLALLSRRPLAGIKIVTALVRR